MARGSNQANTAATSANNLSNAYADNASNIYGALTPELEGMASHPAGMSPSDLAKANTSVLQSAGGSNASSVGQGALLGARSRNAGAPAAAIAESVREGGQRAGEGTLGVDLANEKLKQQQQQEGLGGLQSLYGSNLGGSINALGETAANVNANTNAYNSSYDWANSILDPYLQAGSKAATMGG